MSWSLEMKGRWRRFKLLDRRRNLKLCLLFSAPLVRFLCRVSEGFVGYCVCGTADKRAVVYLEKGCCSTGTLNSPGFRF